VPAKNSVPVGEIELAGGDCQALIAMSVLISELFARTFCAFRRELSSLRRPV
jgi:hypothetical protein